VKRAIAPDNEDTAFLDLRPHDPTVDPVEKSGGERSITVAISEKRRMWCRDRHSPQMLEPGRGGGKSRMREQIGFSLIELLIVVAIILTIAAISIPNLLRARIAANDASAVASLRSLNTAQISYNSSYPTIGFATTRIALGGTSCAPPGSIDSCLIDTQLASGSKSGYSFTLLGTSGTPNATYPIRADPLSPNQTGVRYFCAFADAVIRFGSASLTSCTTTVSPLQ
jgi:type IV pilus assembly protein PilA